MTEHAPSPRKSTKTIGTLLQVLVAVAILADLAFIAAVGFQLSDQVEATGIALAATCAAVLLAGVSRVASRIGEPG